MPFDPPAAGGLAAVANMRTTLTLRLLVSSSKDKDKDKDKASAAAASQQQAATQGGAEVALDVSGGGGVGRVCMLVHRFLMYIVRYTYR